MNSHNHHHVAIVALSTYRRACHFRAGMTRTDHDADGAAFSRPKTHTYEREVAAELSSESAEQHGYLATQVAEDRKAHRDTTEKGLAVGHANTGDPLPSLILVPFLIACEVPNLYSCSNHLVFLAIDCVARVVDTSMIALGAEVALAASHLSIDAGGVVPQAVIRIDQVEEVDRRNDMRRAAAEVVVAYDQKADVQHTLEDIVAHAEAFLDAFVGMEEVHADKIVAFLPPFPLMASCLFFGKCMDVSMFTQRLSFFLLESPFRGIYCTILPNTVVLRGN